MNSPADELTGVQTPSQASVPPAASRADAEDCAFLASRYGLTPDPWQREVLDGWLGVDGAGRWSSPRCGLALCRQQGKNALLEMRQLYGMLVLGERFLHTAHEVKTGQKAFQRLCGFFDNPKVYPKLHARAATIRRANGQEAIVLDNGGSFELVARSRGSGRGFSVDVLVIDEAQELSEDALAALLPTISASANPQTIFTGTPPGPNADGAIFTRVRSDGLAGDDPRLCWHAWGVEGAVDLDDVEQWARANPALGIRLNLATIADERAVMDDETFGRERLGSWSSAGVHRVIGAEAWARCAEPNLADSHGEVALAVDVSPDRSTTTVTAAGWTADKTAFVDVIESRRGEPDWAVHRIVEMWTRHDVRAVVVDGISAANSLIDPLQRAGVAVTVTNATAMAKACGGLYDAVQARSMRHLDQPALNVALSVARKRRIGDGGFGWSRKDSESDITALVGATLALWGLTSSEVAPKPRKRSGRATFV